MLHIKILSNNKAKLVYPRRWQFIFDLGTGEMSRIPNKKFPDDEEVKEIRASKTIENLYMFYKEMK